MTSALTITVEFAPGVIDAFQASVSSLEHILEASLDVGEVAACRAIVDGDIGGLATCRTGEGRLTLEGTDLFRRFAMAVLALHIDGHIICVEYSHGWPILSLLVGTATMRRKGSGVQPGPGRAVTA